MKTHAELLKLLLQKSNLSPVEVKEGVVACFINTNREFVRRRTGDVNLQIVDATLKQLIDLIFEENDVDPQHPDIHLLKRAQEIVEAQSGFEADPELLKMHKGIIDALFAKAGG